MVLAGPSAGEAERRLASARERAPHAHNDRLRNTSIMPADVLRAYYISSHSEGAPRLQSALQSTPVAFERWPAIMGGPHLLESHRSYLGRGVERHLLAPRCTRLKLSCGLANVSTWGQIGIYLSHVTLMEHVASSHGDHPNGTVLILQDDVQLSPSWFAILQRTAALLHAQHVGWTRCLLAWFGALRAEDCDEHLCRVRPPPGPINGKRYYHGLQASLLRVRAARCLTGCLARAPIKSIDSALVLCEPACEPGTTWALRAQHELGGHARGSERAQLDASLRRRRARGP